jgi:hypothetical protein
MSTILAEVYIRQAKPTKRREVCELTEASRTQVLDLLAQDPLRSVQLRGMIEDFGICHPAHRGRFFGYFEDRHLTAVALLGHAIVIYGDGVALDYFAEKAAEIRVKGHVIFGPRAQVEAFTERLSRCGREIELVREFHWMVCHRAAASLNQLQLRRANLDELDMVVDAQAEMLLEATGSDPRVTDPEGFRRRVADRIERGRVWVRIQDGKVVFKADLQSVTEEVVYLEGIWTHQDYRRRGIAKSCVTELTHRLLRRHMALCLVVEPDEEAAMEIYQHVGFKVAAEYRAHYLKPLP